MIFLTPYKDAEDATTRMEKDLLLLGKTQRLWKHHPSTFGLTALWATVISSLERVNATDDPALFQHIVAAGYVKCLSDIIITFAHSGDLGKSDAAMVSAESSDANKFDSSALITSSVHTGPLLSNA